jgi:hypothetical protein
LIIEKEYKNINNGNKIENDPLIFPSSNLDKIESKIIVETVIITEIKKNQSVNISFAFI